MYPHFIDPHSTFNSLPPPKLSVQHPPVVQELQDRDQPQVGLISLSCNYSHCA